MRNIDADIVEVKHTELRRWSDSSLFKSHCPVCNDGILLVRRDQDTFELLDHDRCVSCGQLVRYLDIERLRKMERA